MGCDSRTKSTQEVRSGWLDLLDSNHADGLTCLGVTLCGAPAQVVSHKVRTKRFQEMRFDLPVPFNMGDAGPPGGIQVRPRLL
jgi:hypothetical protein